MKKSLPKKDFMIKQTLKKEDYLELPMDESFYDKMHEKIMQSVEKTEIQSQSKWSNAQVFLETSSNRYRSVYKKAVKLVVVTLVTSIAIGFLAVSRQLYVAVEARENLNNQARIIQEAKRNPQEWARLVANYQSENDFYAEVLSRRNDLATMVEIEKVMTQSL